MFEQIADDGDRQAMDGGDDGDNDFVEVAGDDVGDVEGSDEDDDDDAPAVVAKAAPPSAKKKGSRK